MTETKLAARGQAHWRAKASIALLAATAALTAGTQALAPAPAAAMISEGEECGDPGVDCEPGGGGGTSGGADSTYGGGSIVGSEVIVVTGTAPPPCTFCRPSQPGGRPQAGRDDGRNPQPRHGGRPVRVGDGPQPTGWKKRCRKEEGRYRSAVNRTLWFETAQGHLVWKWRNLQGSVALAGAKRDELKKTLAFMLTDPDFYGRDLIAGIEAELALSERELEKLGAAYREVAGSKALDLFWPLLEAERAAKKPFEACRKTWEPKEPEPRYDVN